jgi:hypothetical protein
MKQKWIPLLVASAWPSLRPVADRSRKPRSAGGRRKAF